MFAVVGFWALGYSSSQRTWYGLEACQLGTSSATGTTGATRCHEGPGRRGGRGRSERGDRGGAHELGGDR